MELADRLRDGRAVLAESDKQEANRRDAIYRKALAMGDAPDTIGPDTHEHHFEVDPASGIELCTYCRKSRVATKSDKQEAKSCRTGYYDICHAAKFDGVVCPEDECDIDDGVRVVAKSDKQEAVALDQQTKAQIESLARHSYGGRFAVYMSGDDARALLAHPIASADVRDAELLDWLDAANKPFKMGWCVSVAPAGNVSVRSVIQLDGEITTIRAAIVAAIAANRASEEGVRSEIRSQGLPRLPRSRRV